MDTVSESQDFHHVWFQNDQSIPFATYNINLPSQPKQVVGIPTLTSLIIPSTITHTLQHRSTAMAGWKIEQCTVADAAALARNNMAAFWEDPTWIALWPKDITLDFLIEQSTKRQARNLLRSREVTRHEKAVDPTTGAVVGYARWILPRGHAIAADGKPVWTEAQVPEVSEEERKHYEDLAASAWWNPQEGMDEIDAKNEVVMERILSERPYITLDYLAVHPENQGKGIGTALVQSGIRHAEQLRLPIFILAFKAGRSIYERLGFREVDRVIQDDTKYGGEGEYSAYFMVYGVPTKPRSRQE